MLAALRAALCRAAVAACALCPLGAAASAAEHTVFYGGSLRWEQAADLAFAAAWMDALDNAAAILARDATMRLAELDRLQLRGLAAVLPGSRASVRTELPHNLGSSTAPSVPGKVTGVPSPFAPDAADISRALAAAEARALREEIIVRMEHVLPEALELAALAHAAYGFDVNPGSRDPSHEEKAVNHLLGKTMGRVTACVRYLEALDLSDDAAAQNPAALLGLLDLALEGDPDWVPPRAAQAEHYLRLDRPQAALRALAVLIPLGKEAAGTYTPKTEIQARARALRVRALAYLRSGQPALAEQDLDASLRLDASQAETWLARGAARQVREQTVAMCGDYLQACRLGLCDGLAAARAKGVCLP